MAGLEEFYRDNPMPRRENGKLVQSMPSGPRTSPNGLTQEEANAFYSAVGLPQQPSPMMAQSGGPLTTRSVKSVPIDPRTGMPASQVARAPSPRTNVGLGASLADLFAFQQAGDPRQPAGSVVIGKDQSRLSYNDLPQNPFAQNPALAAVDMAAGVPLPRQRPERFADVPLPQSRPVGAMAGAGLNVPLPRARPAIGGEPETGLFGSTMSPGMANILATDPAYEAQRTGRLNASSGGSAPTSVAQMFEPAGQRKTSTNGYVYESDGSGGYKNVGSTRPAGTTPAQDYAQRSAKAHKTNTVMDTWGSSGGGFDGSGGGGSLVG